MSAEVPDGMERPCSILVADPNLFLRETMAAILWRQDNVRHVLQVGEREPLVESARDHHPDIILADMSLLPDRAFVARLRVVSSASRVLAMVEQESGPYAKAARCLGVDGVVEKSRVGDVPAARGRAGE